MNGAFSAVFMAEIRQLLRDRRALFAAILLPAILYPLVFLSQNALQNLSRESLAAREVGVVLDVTRAPRDVAIRVRKELEEREPIRIYDRDASSLLPDTARDEARVIVTELLADDSQLVVTAIPDLAVKGHTTMHLWFDVKDDTGREALDRARAAIRKVADDLAQKRRDELLGGDPARGLELEVSDIATDEEASGQALGRLLPLIAVLVLLSGGSYAALAVFAGERESGTLETLLVQPVRLELIAWGKFAAVFVLGLVTIFTNLGSLLLSMRLGLGSLGSVTGSSVGLVRLAAGVVYLPGCLLACALLCLVCGRARTFREGQATILPVLLLVLVPTAIVFQPEVELDYLLAVIPFTGPALALRDALRGSLATGPAAAMFASHLLWSYFLLARLASILDAEKVLANTDTEAESGSRQLLARHALLWGGISVFSVYVAGGWMQSRDLESGMLFTFWLLLPALALACAYGVRKRTAWTWTRALGVGRPAWRYVLGALLLAPVLVYLATVLGTWQRAVLPMPEGALEGSALEAYVGSLSAGKLLFLFALSPGVWEELLFRGAILSAMRRDMSARRAVLWQAVLFGAVHASIYRLAPTAILGGLFAMIALRAKSIWPVVLLHAAYDAILILFATERLVWNVEEPSFLVIAAGVAGALLCAWPEGGKTSVPSEGGSQTP